ncbi:MULTISPECIES: sigma-70 family RNA polymerase sigma factor [Roseateles]|uniref:RNA polymerase sigma-70 factor (ECF subfamily) n=1 Tax=Pelomonas aquatica TaxID=431058 RepID=A0ABU1ZAN6_9BURK|nr:MULTISPECIES: sigma-70 family RNA polymerase sigma factor [Roseateles]MDR7297503.1 RNA polymerase sigma-70 factor (ECF subfamily) [Pelomonas aquatica]
MTRRLPPAPDDDALPAHAPLFDDVELQAADAEPADATAEPAARSGCVSLDDAQVQAWIAGIVEHDERALLALYEATLSRVYGLVLRLVRRSQLAEEVAEEVYYQVWRQAPRFDPQRGRPLTWLLGMARSRAIDAIRREARFQHEALDEEAAPLSAPAAESGDELLAVAQGHAELHRALLLLKPQPRQLVALAFFSGLSHEEIASQTCLPLGTVKSQIRRALITLRDTLGDAGAHALPA